MNKMRVTALRAMCAVVLALATSLTAMGQDAEHPYSSAARPRRLPEQAPAALLGVVQDSERGPLRGAQVVLVPENGARKIQVVSSRDGSFGVPEVPAGKYQITFELA